MTTQMNFQDEALLTLVGGPDVVTHTTKPRVLDKVTTEFVAEASNRAVLEKLGFTIGEVVDDLFTAVTAPEGWGLVSTDHYMYSHVIDGAGRIRGQLGYKGASYDRWASFYLLTRYTIDEVQPENWFRLHRPETLTRKVERPVRVQDRDERGWPKPYEDEDAEWVYSDRDFMYGYGRYPGKRYQPPARYEMKMVEEPLPADQQPKPQAFDKGFGVKDRATGVFLFQSETYVCEPNARYDERDEIEKPLRAAAWDWMDAHFPDHRDVTAYW